MATTWANEAPEKRASDNGVLHPPAPPPVAPSLRRASVPPEGARYRPDYSTTGDRVDFDRVMLESWRPKAVRPQTDPFYVPGPGSEPPPIPEVITVEPLSRTKIVLAGGIAASTLIVVASAAYLLGRSASTPPSVAAPAPSPSIAQVHVGRVTVEPLPAASAPVSSPPVSSVAVAPASSEPRILPLATAEVASPPAARPRAHRTRRARARLTAAREAEARAPVTVAATADATATADASVAEPAAPATEDAVTDGESWEAPRLAGWDEVVTPTPAADAAASAM